MRRAMCAAIVALGLASFGCSDDGGDGGGFCSAGTLDCTCHPGFGCEEGLSCVERVCVDCEATPGACASPDGGM